MLGYRSKSFARIHALVREIAATPLDAALALRCQRLLIAEIQHAERKVSRYRTELKAQRRQLNTSRLPRGEARRIRTRIKWIEARIDAYRRSIYIWRCFGDAIAFNGLDKYAVKATYFETTTGAVKQHAGFLSGKSGLSEEIRLLEEITSKGMPCVLTDLTNSLRHGDICILTGGDPYLIEVKSGNRLNERGKRQVTDIAKIHSFLETDMANDWHGVDEVRRVAAHADDVSYVDEINTCIVQAERDGSSLLSPEPGLHYIAIYSDGGELEPLLSSLKPQLEMPIAYHLKVGPRTCLSRRLSATRDTCMPSFEANFL
jgi:hypothetical protein